MNKRRAAALIAAMLMTVVCLAGCGETTTSGSNTPSGNNSATPAQNDVKTVYADKALGFQMEMPVAGEQIAIMHTSMGDISIRFFPEAAPKAVENFITHAKNGYYDGLTFHRVCSDFMIQGGDPKGNGTGGESIWGAPFEDEFDQKLLNLRGSLSMANSGVATNGSQFFINQAKPTGATAEELKKTFDYNTMLAQYTAYYQQYVQYYGDSFTSQFPTAQSFIDGYCGGINPVSTLVPDEAWELYAKTGGNINLDGAYRTKGGHTVFGQVFDGMDVVDAIAAVQTDDNDKPVTDVIIKSIEVVTYGG